MGFTLQQLAELVKGTVHGDPATPIETARPLAEAGPGSITFLENEKNTRQLKGCLADALVVPIALAGRRADLLALIGRQIPILAVVDSLHSFVEIVRYLQPGVPEHEAVIDPRAAIHPTATIGEGCDIGPFVTVGEGSVIGARCRLHAGAVVGRRCRIGDDSELHPHVVLYDGIQLGKRVIVQANAVLGADGFGYRLQDGKHVKVPQFGTVEIGDDVEIGAGTTIDRGTFGVTRVASGTKIDNLVQIGHNCQIGPHNLIVSQVGIAGSSTTGAYVVLAGQVGIADHVHIGDGVLVGARSAIHRDVNAGERILGTPGRPESEEKRILLSLEKLPELRRDVRHLKQHLGLAQ